MFEFCELIQVIVYSLVVRGETFASVAATISFQLLEFIGYRLVQCTHGGFYRAPEGLRGDFGTAETVGLLQVC